MSEQAATPEAILQAAEQLYSKGDEGFSNTDAGIVSCILRTPTKHSRQVKSLWAILQSYKDKLLQLGVHFETLIPPQDNGSISTPARRTVSLKLVDTPKGQMVAVNAPYEESLVELIKNLKSRYWDKESKAWFIPFNPIDIEFAIAAFRAQTGVALVIDPVLLTRVEEGKRSYKESRSESSDLKIPLKLELYPFQRAGVKWIDDHDGRALVADEMGVGKTCQALGWVSFRRNIALPALVICPALVRVNWYREVLKFTDLKPLIISGKTSIKAFEKAGLDVSERPLPGYDITITNYDLLSVETPKTWVKQLLGKKVEAQKYAELHLAWAGNQAMEFLLKAIRKCKDMESKNRLSRVMGVIEKQGEKARKKRDPEYKIAYVNGIPFEEFVKAGYKTLILDESHYIKDGDSQRAKGSLEISYIVKNSICLTGTPIDNRPREIWTQTQAVNRSVFPNFFEYGRRYCNAFQKQVGPRVVWDFSGASNLAELEKVLRSTIMIRRTKEQVLKELPPKTRTLIPFIVEESADKEYRKVEQESVERLRKIKKERDDWKTLLDSIPKEDRKNYVARHAERAAQASKLTDLAISEIEKLKEAAVNAKLPESIKFTMNLKETQKKVLVFAVHHKTIDRLLKEFREAGIKTDFIDGRVSGTDRQKVVDAFQGGDLEILVCGIRAASIGLTLTACHTVAFLELDWNASVHDQAEARTSRIGQSKPVTIYYLLLLGSIEEKIARMIDAKRSLVHSIMGEGEKGAQEGGILDALLDEIVGK